MNTHSKRTVKDIKSEIRKLSDHYFIAFFDKRAINFIRNIIKDNEPKIKKLKEELETMVRKNKEPKPRWPENTPQSVINFCNKYWKGTTESEIFRIHCWNDKAVWTSWPSGGYSTQGGWNKVKATFFMLPLNETPEIGMKPIIELEGKVSQNTMQSELDKLTVKSGELKL